MAGIQSMSQAEVKQNFGTIKDFAKTMEKAKVVMAPGVKGHAYIEVNGHHMRMSEVAKKFQELGTKVTPEDSEAYASVGIRLAVAERTIKPMSKEGVSIIKKIGTLIRKAVDKLAGPRSRATERMETYKKGVELHPHKGEVTGAKDKEFHARFAKRAESAINSPEVLNPHFKNVDTKRNDTNIVLNNLNKLKQMLKGKGSLGEDLKISAAAMKKEERQELADLLLNDKEFNLDPRRIKEGPTGIVTIESEIHSHPELSSALNERLASVFEGESGKELDFKLGGLKGEKLKDALTNLEKNLTAINGKIGITHRIDTSNLTPHEKAELAEELKKGNFDVESLGIYEQSGWDQLTTGYESSKISKINNKEVKNQFHTMKEEFRAAQAARDKIFKGIEGVDVTSRIAQLKTPAEQKAAIENLTKNLQRLREVVTSDYRRTKDIDLGKFTPELKNKVFEYLMREHPVDMSKIQLKDPGVGSDLEIIDFPHKA